MIKNSERIKYSGSLIMDSHYDDLFDLHISDSYNPDIYYHSEIPKMDYLKFKDILIKDLEVINSSKMELTDWIKFKYHLMKQENKWGDRVFNWSVRGALPFIGIGVNWNVLEDKPTRYFQVHMAFENVWMGPENLYNVWDVIPIDLEDPERADEDIGNSDSEGHYF